MTKKGKNKHDDNTFYFPGQKAQSEDSARNGFEKDQPDREEEEDEEEMQDQFIEFGASGKGVIPTIVHPPPDDGGMNGAATLEDGEEERGQWGNKLDFLFSCISVSVGLGNVWWFPYLCYQNGGGAFLLVYFIAMFLCGIPIFFQEVAIGQYLGSGGMTLVAQLCPILKGVGIATMCLVFYLDIYYCVIIAWTFFYFIAAFTAIPDLPWNTCDGWWNKEPTFYGSKCWGKRNIDGGTSKWTGRNAVGTRWNPIFIVGSSLPHYLERSPFIGKDHLVYRSFPIFCNGNSFGACFDPSRCFYGTLLLCTG